MLVEFLTKQMPLTIKTIDSQSELLALSPKILDLFSICFAPKTLEFGLWEWAYIKNPVGAPCVSIALDQEKNLVGHYATIPIDLVNSCGQKLRSHLSMTTMIEKHFIKYGLFRTLAQSTYNKLKYPGIDVVYGFPNKNSKAGFKKRLSWNVNDTCLRYFEAKRDYINTKQYQDYYYSSHAYTIDLSTASNLEWRLSKPGNKYVYESGAYFKSYAGGFDLIYIENKEEFESSNNNSGFNAISYADESSDSDTSYHSGHRILQGASKFSLFCQLACSDVFNHAQNSFSHFNKVRF